MPTERIRSHSPEETAAAARALAPRLAAEGGVVWLHGPLGAGKTLFARALFAALGVDPGDVTSPTFALLNVYQSRTLKERPLYHLDLYRTTSARDLETIGLEEVLAGPAITLVEWAERLGDAWGEPDLRVRIDTPRDDPDARDIEISSVERPLRRT